MKTQLQLINIIVIIIIIIIIIIINKLNDGISGREILNYIYIIINIYIINIYI